MKCTEMWEAKKGPQLFDAIKYQFYVHSNNVTCLFFYCFSYHLSTFIYHQPEQCIIWYTYLSLSFKMLKCMKSSTKNKTETKKKMMRSKSRCLREFVWTSYNTDTIDFPTTVFQYVIPICIQCANRKNITISYHFNITSGRHYSFTQ